MTPDEVPAALVEKFANALGLAYVAEQMPEYARNLRLGLAAVVPEIQAQAWDEGLEYARAEARGELQHYRKEVGPGTVMATDTQPVFDAIDGAGTRFNYRTYNAHIHSVTLMGLLDLLTPAPRIEVDGDVYEADEDPNPHRAARARLAATTEGPT